MGTIVVMGRLYRLPGTQTIELLVMYPKTLVLACRSWLAGLGLIDRTATQYQDV
jgi:hypothetical protein